MTSAREGFPDSYDKYESGFIIACVIKVKVHAYKEYNFVVKIELEATMWVYCKRRTRTRGHGQTDRRTVLTDSYDGKL